MARRPSPAPRKRPSCGVARARRPFPPLPAPKPRKAPPRPAARVTPAAPPAAPRKRWAHTGARPTYGSQRSPLPEFPRGKPRAPLGHIVGTPRSRAPRTGDVLGPAFTPEVRGIAPLTPADIVRIYRSLPDGSRLSASAHYPMGVRLHQGYVTVDSPPVLFSPRVLDEMDMGRLLARGARENMLGSALSTIYEEVTRGGGVAQASLYPDPAYGPTPVVAERLGGTVVIDSADAIDDARPVRGKAVSLREAFATTTSRPALARVTVNGRPITLTRNVLRLIAPDVIRHKAAGLAPDEIASLMRRSLRYMLNERGTRLGMSPFAKIDTRHGLLDFTSYQAKVLVHVKDKVLTLDADPPRRMEDRPAPAWRAPEGLTVVELSIPGRFLREMVALARWTEAPGIDFAALVTGQGPAGNLKDASAMICGGVMLVCGGTVKRSGPSFHVSDLKLLAKASKLAKGAKGMVDVRYDFDAGSVKFSAPGAETLWGRNDRPTSTFRPNFDAALWQSQPLAVVSNHQRDCIAEIADIAEVSSRDPTRQHITVVRLVPHGRGVMFAQATNGHSAVNVRTAAREMGTVPYARDAVIPNAMVRLVDQLVPRSQVKRRADLTLTVVGSGRWADGQFSFVETGEGFHVIGANMGDPRHLVFPTLDSILHSVSPEHKDVTPGAIGDASDLRKLVAFLDKKACTTADDEDVRRIVLEIRDGVAVASCFRGAGKFTGDSYHPARRSSRTVHVNLDLLLSALRALLASEAFHEGWPLVTLTIGDHPMDPVGFMAGMGANPMTDANVAVVMPMGQ